jgi:hypothetical protein
MIETVLFGKRALVPSAEFLKLMKTKEALVEEATAVQKAAKQMCAAEHLEATCKVFAKIQRINRKIAKSGQFVTYL